MSKRLLDIAVAGVVLAIASPLLALAALAVLIVMGRPVFFRQVRPGMNELPFTLLKLRTMRDARDSAGRLLDDADRLTLTGGFLRRTSLDELPQLWNVLRGDMSLVGPRPLLTSYLSRYTPEQRTRHNVKPGITGWAQINGRNAIGWSDKLALDVWYVKNRGFMLDFRILLMTALVILRSRGVSAPGHATMPPFTGAAEQ
jgi:sugar transferase EpsL